MPDSLPPPRARVSSPRPVRAPNAMVASADQLATQAGVEILARGGNAVDAAIAVNAVLAVTSPHLCGLGGDLYALVADDGTVSALNATGRAPAAADPDALRRQGHRDMPFALHPAPITVPGCVDGWAALHHRFASMPLTDLTARAVALAESGFPASPLLVGALDIAQPAVRSNLAEIAAQASRPGRRVVRPGVGRTLRDIADGGRAAFYDGAFGAGVQRVTGGLIGAGDLAVDQAHWVDPLQHHLFGVDVMTMPPNSQGYLLLGSGLLVQQLLGDADPPDVAEITHLLIEASKAAGFDRPDRLHDRADGDALVAMVAGRAAMIDRDRAATRSAPIADGDTTYLCVVDGAGMAVSLIQSNAAGFGSGLVEPTTGINLHNRGIGFNLIDGHPAEYRPGRRPPHTLSPALVCRDGEVLGVLGSMGGDAQPQIVLQLLIQLARFGRSPADAISAPRWVLRGPASGFDTWTSTSSPVVAIEADVDPALPDALTRRGHRVELIDPWSSTVGHAHAIWRDDSTNEGFWNGAADPRTVIGSAAGI